MSSGLFIVIEGTDGSGTSTQVERVRERLADRGIPTLATRQPSGGPVGLLIREALTHRLQASDGQPVQLDWRTLALLFAADRNDQLVREIHPALERGAVVLCDRYVLSSLLYQSATAEDPAHAASFVRDANQDATVPDLVAVLVVPSEVAGARRAQRGGQAELFEVEELQVRLATLYAQAQEWLPGQKVLLLDGTRAMDDLTGELVAAITRIWEARAASR